MHEMFLVDKKYYLIYGHDDTFYCVDEEMKVMHNMCVDMAVVGRGLDKVLLKYFLGLDEMGYAATKVNTVLGYPMMPIEMFQVLALHFIREEDSAGLDMYFSVCFKNVLYYVVNGMGYVFWNNECVFENVFEVHVPYRIIDVRYKGVRIFGDGFIAKMNDSTFWKLTKGEINQHILLGVLNMYGEEEWVCLYDVYMGREM